MLHIHESQHNEYHFMQGIRLKIIHNLHSLLLIKICFRGTFYCNLMSKWSKFNNFIFYGEALGAI